VVPNLPKALVAPLLTNKMPSFVLGFAISRQNYLVKVSARGPKRDRGSRLRDPDPVTPFCASLFHFVMYLNYLSVLHFLNYDLCNTSHADA